MFLFHSRAASQIRSFLETAARELSLERFENFERDLFQVSEHALHIFHALIRPDLASVFLGAK